MYGYFEIQAKIGITKHMGGLQTTRKLLKLCQVNKSDPVLVVGSGNGVSAIKIHEITGCKVTVLTFPRIWCREPGRKRSQKLNF